MTNVYHCVNSPTAEGSSGAPLPGPGEATDGLGEPDVLPTEVTIGADGVAFLCDERGDCYESQPTDHPAGIIATMPDGSTVGFDKVQSG